MLNEEGEGVNGGNFHTNVLKVVQENFLSDMQFVTTMLENMYFMPNIFGVEQHQER